MANAAASGNAQTGTSGEVAAIRPFFAVRLFLVCAGLVLASLAVSLGGKWLGHRIAMAGHTADATIHEIVIGNNVLAVPANAIRFARERRDGIATRLGIYLRWPELEGYTAATRDDFNHAGGAHRIVFLSFAEQATSRDMSGRFAPVYDRLIERPGEPVAGGLTRYRFRPQAGYTDEILLVAERPDDDPFVARCLAGRSAAESLAPCMRDIHLGEELSLVYRFPEALLPDWRRLDAAIRDKAVGYLRTAR